jgi:hypothetical protein
VQTKSHTSRNTNELLTEGIVIRPCGYQKVSDVTSLELPEEEKTYFSADRKANTFETYIIYI